jgi:hypothetical protein
MAGAPPSWLDPWVLAIRLFESRVSRSLEKSKDDQRHLRISIAWIFFPGQQGQRPKPMSKEVPALCGDLSVCKDAMKTLDSRARHYRAPWMTSWTGPMPFCRKRRESRAFLGPQDARTAKIMDSRSFFPPRSTALHFAPSRVRARWD